MADLRIHEPPSGGYDLRTILTDDEYKIEQICDEERYRALYKNEVEEAIYHGKLLLLMIIDEYFSKPSNKKNFFFT